MLVKIVNKWEVLVYQKETERKSNISILLEGDIIHNLTTNPISKKKMPYILKEV